MFNNPMEEIKLPYSKLLLWLCRAGAGLHCPLFALGVLRSLSLSLFPFIFFPVGTLKHLRKRWELRVVGLINCLIGQLNLGTAHYLLRRTFHWYLLGFKPRQVCLGLQRDCYILLQASPSFFFVLFCWGNQRTGAVWAV